MLLMSVALMIMPMSMIVVMAAGGMAMIMMMRVAMPVIVLMIMSAAFALFLAGWGCRSMIVPTIISAATFLVLMTVTPAPFVVGVTAAGFLHADCHQVVQAEHGQPAP